MNKFGLREKKAAILKTAILDEMLRLLKDKDLNEISLDELCSNVNTTKVTFFKYFTHKEQVLDYFIQRWLYDRSYEISCKGLQGLEGINHVFQTISSEKPLNQKLMIALIHYYSKLNEEPAAIHISDYEYYLFNAEAYNQQVKALDLCQVFTHYLSQIDAIEPSEFENIINLLIALMYGVPIQSHITRTEDMYPLYKLGVERILQDKGFKD